MASSASSLQAELTAAFDAASRRGRFISCEHCGTMATSSTPHCDCADRIRIYGALGCSCCGIAYGFFDTIATYIGNYYGDEKLNIEEYIDFTRCGYMSRFLKAMPKPCAECSPEYIEEHAYLADTYQIWFRKQEERMRSALSRYYGRYYDDNDYDEPCTSGSGGICRCCGD